MLFATLKTDIIERHSPSQPAEGGVFEVEIHMTDAELRVSASPRQDAFRKMATILGLAIDETEVPREFWYVTFPKPIQREFNLPPRQRMSV